MREIKFRYWDTFDYEHKMIYFDLGMVSGGKVYPNMKTTMQYTGLKDKNGKEIYEGDIVKWADWEQIKQCTPVEWDQEMCRFVCRLRNGTWRMFGSELSVEVIGNIYENPDLLK